MTILKGSEKIVASLNQFGVVRRVRRGHYVIAEPIELNDELTRFLVFADMLVNRSSSPDVPGTAGRGRVVSVRVPCEQGGTCG